MKVFKFQFKIEDSFSLMLSPDCNTLKVDLQDGIPTMWILVDPEDVTKKTEFRLYGTGHEISKDGNMLFSHHAGSFFQGEYVWHLFQQN